MQRLVGMMEYAKDLASNIGGACADAAKFLGGHTADGAKFVGGKSADAARFVAGGTVDLAKRVGPKRGIIGLVVIGGAIVGGIYLARYLRSRAAEANEEGEDIKDKRVKKAASRAQHAAQGVSH